MANETITNGVMLNAYPDSIGSNLSDLVSILQKPEFEDVFSLFYVLPTFFNSDLDRGFSIIDYDINEELVTKEDIQALEALDIMLKFDIVLNHLSVASPQFKDLVENGDDSAYKDFFIDWNEFWKDNGALNTDGIIIPKKEYLDKLFMRKSGLPILKVRFPDGTERPYWNTFYQKITYESLVPEDFQQLEGLSTDDTVELCHKINNAIAQNQDLHSLDFGAYQKDSDQIINILEKKRRYLGQMDVNAKSPQVWNFYEDVLAKVKGYGGKILRLDAFAYLHKEVGESNFFNTPGTWDYLSQINDIAQKNDLLLLPEVHAEYGAHLHNEIAEKGYFIYDFFLPGLVIHTLEKADNRPLLKWANEIISNKFRTVNMLGCHDGIPVLDLKGKLMDDGYHEGLLTDPEIEDIMELLLKRGGRVKNLYGADGKKISYYQVNATYYSALGESDEKMLFARALQLFMPGIPQVWYLDIFVGPNDYAAVEKAGNGGHKEINRTTLTIKDIENGLQKEVVKKQLEMIRLRNTHQAFLGTVLFHKSDQHLINIQWTNDSHYAQLEGNLRTLIFKIIYSSDAGESFLLM